MIQFVAGIFVGAVIMMVVTVVLMEGHKDDWK